MSCYVSNPKIFEITYKMIKRTPSEQDTRKIQSHHGWQRVPYDPKKYF
jgi:hypothetical protein